MIPTLAAASPPPTQDSSQTAQDYLRTLNIKHPLCRQARIGVEWGSDLRQSTTRSRTATCVLRAACSQRSDYAPCVRRVRTTMGECKGMIAAAE